MTLKQIKAKYKLPSRWNKENVTCYLEGLKKGREEFNSLHKAVELQYDFKSIMESMDTNNILKKLKK